MAIKCPACKGSKQVVGLGNMLKDCPECEGVGFVAEKKDEPEKQVTSIKERREMLNKDKWKK